MLIKPNIEPGHYSGLATLSLFGERPVSSVAFSENGPPPVISQYIAYDQLDPPSPFLAVTQDGLGNVVYDGGFPKFYNSKAPAESVTDFSGLSASFKFLYNALNFCANKAKVTQGNKNVLILGDRTAGWTYSVKSALADQANGFQTSFERLCAIAGFTPTFKVKEDYSANQLDPTTAELNNYCLVLLMSSQSTNTKLITDSAVANLVAFREDGNGLIVITDHGAVLNTEAEALAFDSYSGFFNTANRLIVNFGAWFSGDYSRSPVNVGYIRSNYGDHPLYAGMDDSEDIFAGGSESEVKLAEVTSYSKWSVPPADVSASPYTLVNLLATKVSGALHSERWLYTNSAKALIDVVTQDGVSSDSQLVTSKKHLQAALKSNYPELGDLTVSIYNNDRYLGRATVSGETNVFTWNGDTTAAKLEAGTLRFEVSSPFVYSQSLPVTIQEPAVDYFSAPVALSQSDFNGQQDGLVGGMRAFVKTVIDPNYPARTMAEHFAQIRKYYLSQPNYANLKVHLVDSWSELFSSGLGTQAGRTAVNRTTGEVAFATEKGWALSDASTEVIFGSGRVLEDFFGAGTYSTTSAITATTPSESSPFSAEREDYGWVTPCGTNGSWFDNTVIEGSSWISDRPNSHEGIVPVGDRQHLRKSFYSEYGHQAYLYVAADDSVVSLAFNGVTLDTTGVNYSTVTGIFVNVKQGWNVIHALVENQGSDDNPNPSGFFCYLEIAGTGEVLVATDETWMKKSEPALKPLSLYVDGSVDEVLFDWNPGMVLYSDKAFAYEIEYKYDTANNAATDAPIVSFSRLHDGGNTNVNQGVDLWAGAGSGNHLKVHISGSSPWNSGDQVDLMRVQTDPSDPSFIDALDGNYHVIRVEYDGSELASGVKFFVDGVEQATLSTRQDFPVFTDKVLSHPGTPLRLGTGTKTDDVTGEEVPYISSTVGWFRSIRLWREDVLIFWSAFNDGVNAVTVHDYGKYSNHSETIDPLLWVDESSP